MNSNLQPWRMESFNKAVIVNGDGITVEGVGGHRIAVCTHGLVRGVLYFEIEVLNDIGHIRVGVSNQRNDLNGPLGLGVGEYSYGSFRGYKFTGGVKHRYGPTFGIRDFIGVEIGLGSGRTEMRNYLVCQEAYIKEPSYIKFYKNGEDLGIAFSDLEYGVYYPAISLYQGAKVKFIWEPFVAFPPRYGVGCWLP
ncbi:Set1/Ash2 histone methyltransferase complex subunit ASH2 [Astathelohania contejeani]|uniref:Set1/Ash2 histone methyltransferase complex subunit ASH2 n=1 Tax=Astathelohania contejeani TaxID=164912 RepID=A0ABQ7HYA8_9MICR|nr:Set1/Ash2 histone methyltransferase complex subunit ASH2 [Thelohania contejeani]